MFAEQIIVTLSPTRGGRADPYHRQIYRQVRAAILEGRLRPGDRLPSTRDLAAGLGLARNTVARAYDDLTAEGYLNGRVGSGTQVARELEAYPPTEVSGAAPNSTAGRGRGTLAEWGRRAVVEVPDSRPPAALEYDFRLGVPDWEAFPRGQWLRLLGRAMQAKAPELVRYGEPAGYTPLREAIARHLALSRHVAATAQRVVIVSGSQQALDLLTRLWVEPGDAVAMEDPGYPDARRAFASAGASVLHVPVDDDGLDVDALIRAAAERPPRLVYLTPSHQFPTGVTLSLRRRLALLEWAARRDVLIVEDDYDSEFRYTGRPVESLQGLDRAGRVVYVGTFSTVLFPPLRVGYVVLPEDLVDPFVKAKWLADRQTATLEQLVLTDFLAEGHFGRHLWQTRRLAAARRATLLAAIAEFFGDRVRPPRARGGMHVMLRLPRPTSSRLSAAELESEVTTLAAERGVGVYPLFPYRARAAATPAVLLGFAALPTDLIREGIRRLAAAVAQATDFGLVG